MCEAVGDLKSLRLRGEELALRDGENVPAVVGVVRTLASRDNPFEIPDMLGDPQVNQRGSSPVPALAIARSDHPMVV